ncbi:MAG: hypothetical protein ACYC7E_18890 [Armatimonadota bacterium]
MLTSEQFEIHEVLTSIFTPGLQLIANDVVKHFQAHQEIVSTGELTVLPLPAEAPPEIPRVVMRSDDKEYTLQAMPSRLNLLWHKQQPDSQLDYEKHIEWVLGALQGYIEKFTIVVGRLACVTRRYVLDDRPSMTLAEHFCQEKWLAATGPLNRPDQFELHAFKTFALGEEDVNSWMRFKSGSFSYAGPGPKIEKPAITVEQDINTMAEAAQTRKISNEEMGIFFRSMPSATIETLDLYFPKG